MPHLSPDQKELISRECEGLAGEERTRKVHELSVLLKCHPSTIYRAVRPALPHEGRQRRADRGRRQCPLPQEALAKMQALSAKGLSAPEVLDLAELNGWVEPGLISAATYNRWLGDDHLSKTQRERWVKPFRRFEESLSNERHYLDMTEIGRYFVDPDGSIGYESVLQMSKNRPGNRKPRLNLFALTDGHSRVKVGLLYMGKNVLNWIDFCVRSWAPKDDPYGFPFQGRPEFLYSDNEGVFRSPLMIRFLAAMDVRYHAHAPGQSRAKGKIERAIQDISKRLEHILRLKVYERGEKPTLTQANQILADQLAVLNNRTHGTTRQEPLLRWRAGFHMDRPIRLMPDPSVTDRFFYAVDYRVIQGDLTVQLGGRKWQLPRKEPFLSYSGFSVPVAYHPGETELRSVYVVIEDVEYEVAHSTPVSDVAGEYRSTAVSDMERRLAALDEVDLSQVEVEGFRDRYVTRTFLPAPGEAMDVEQLDLPRRAITRIRLVQRLQELEVISTPPTPAEKAYLDALYADGAEAYEEDLERIIAELSGGGRAFGLSAAS